MPAAFEITQKEWRRVRRAAWKRAWDLTHNVSRARELVDAAFADAVDPDANPWRVGDPKTLTQHICDRVWSRFGNQITSYEWQNVRDEYDDETMEHPHHRWNPERLLIAKEEEQKAMRLRAALQLRIKDDPLIGVLLEENVEPEPDPEERDTKGRPEGTQAESTRRALKAGYTALEIRLARERLKRHAIAVMKEDRERFG
jgi:hypothetical protein